MPTTSLVLSILLGLTSLLSSASSLVGRARIVNATPLADCVDKCRLNDSAGPTSGSPVSFEVIPLASQAHGACPDDGAGGCQFSKSCKLHAKVKITNTTQNSLLARWGDSGSWTVVPAGTAPVELTMGDWKWLSCNNENEQQTIHVKQDTGDPTGHPDVAWLTFECTKCE